MSRPAPQTDRTDGATDHGGFRSIEDWCRAFLTGEDRASKLDAVRQLPPRSDWVWQSAPNAQRLDGPSRPAPWDVVQRSPKTPTRGAMVHAGQRAHLMHTLAHHELQAAELFAWAILAFPDTPQAFREGLLRIAVEELEHLGLYRAHLQRLGSDYPTEPVRDWFWERGGQCTTPEQFVAFMGLGLEGANLEHSARFAEWFRAAGDDAGAQALEQVEREEVAHVAFARKWFERLTGAELTLDLWQAYLPSPLTPAVFRGRPLNRTARRRAGLSDQFLDDLEAAEPAHRSQPSGPASRALPEDRGWNRAHHWLRSDREPIVWILNLDAEEEWAWEHSRQGGREARDGYQRSPRMESILRLKREPLLRSLVGPRDWIWTAPDGRRAPRGVRAVAWSPTRWARRVAKEQGWLLEQALDPEILAAVNHKGFLVDLQKDSDATIRKRLVHSPVELEACFEALPDTPWRVRRPFGAAGRHLQVIRSRPFSEAQTTWIEQACMHGPLIAEPERRLAWETSTCGWVDARGEVRVAPTRKQNTDATGAWAALGPPLSETESARLGAAFQTAAQRVGSALAQRGYAGPFSLDGWVYADAQGAWRAQPYGDLNARFTMGWANSVRTVSKH